MKIDHSKSLKMIDDALVDLDKRNLSKLIVIKGCTGDGKSTLARKLAERSNALLVDALPLFIATRRKIELPLPTELTKTYIIDAYPFVSVQSLWDVMSGMDSRNGVVILFSYHYDDFNPSDYNNIKLFNLSKERGLVEVINE